MSKLIQRLREDKELIQMKKEWKEKITDEPFWPYNYDEFNGVSDYKKKVRERIDSVSEK